MDTCFRQLNGQTQVSTTDLPNLGYPALDSLFRLGERASGMIPELVDLDRIMEK
ncbi:hypothetical protein WMF31_39420 [Sorangium sp. So ce1036]|uniref:hypothetical protein n=1 Tax=Sorangium sp. So ce1036 TaxID=3133328 RepID=UPI003F047049